MPTTFGYCRVSSNDQSPAMQVDAIKKAYPAAVIREEKKSGTSLEAREILALLLDMISEGDKLVVWKLDRLARSMSDLETVVKALEDKGASLEILDQKIDTKTASGRAFLQMLGVFAEFETNLRHERQMAGIAKAKAERPETYQGRKPTTDGDQIRELLSGGLKPTEVARKLGISRATVYRYRKPT